MKCSLKNVYLTIEIVVVNVMSTDYLLTVMVYKISEMSLAIQAPQEMSPVSNESCVVLAAGCRWCLEGVPLPAGGRLNVHLYLNSTSGSVS